MIVKMDVSINQRIGLVKGVGFVSVNAFCFEASVKQKVEDIKAEQNKQKAEKAPEKKHEHSQPNKKKKKKKTKKSKGR